MVVLLPAVDLAAILLALICALMLTGCATRSDQFAQSANNAVQNVETAAVASVHIGTAILSAILALHQPVRDTIRVIFD